MPSTPSNSSKSTGHQAMVKDPATEVFRCVWCQEQYSSLADLTQHLKEAKHTTATMPKQSPVSSRGSPSDAESPRPLTTAKTKPQSPRSSSKESNTVPRKLVRGQDVWLGKGQEQTRQILKCMWCGESFKSLADLTVHMQETQHYTKVISQEQLSSWRAEGDEANRSTSPPTMVKPLGSALNCRVRLLSG